MESCDIHVLYGNSCVGVDGALRADGELSSVRGRGIKIWIGAVDRTRDTVEWTGERARPGQRERTDSITANSVLFEGVDSIFLNGIVQKRQRVSIIKQPSPRAEHPWTTAIRL